MGSTSVNVRLTPAQLAALDAYIAQQTTKVGRPEAIRRLVEAGLRAKR